MPFDRRFPSAIVCLAASALASGPAYAQAPAPATLDVKMMQDAEALASQGKHAEAAAVYEDLVKKFPQVPSVPEANFRAGYAHYLAGNYDAALASFKKVIDNRNLPPELATLNELSLSMTPQVLAAKAAKLPPGDPARKVALEDAVKQFDVYLTKYPSTDEAESASYGKALALYQLEKFDNSMDVLRGNMTKFAQSPTVQDSQFLLALTLATVASQSMQKATAEDKTADAQYDEAEKLLRDIITKNQNLALINDAQFQIGELLLARGGFLSGEDSKQKQNEIFAKALDAYRSVATKDRVVDAQKKRIAFFESLRNKAGIDKDRAGFEKYKRLVIKEQEKLAQIEGHTDQTQTAKFKTGLIFFTQGKMDETRVLYTHLENLGAIEDPEDKKQALYFVTMSYAAQNVADKAVEKYTAFQGAYKGDPIAQNLQLIMGAMYLHPDSKVKDPNKAIEYFNEGLQLYPKGKAFGTLVLARAGAQIELKQFAEAEKALKDTLAQNPPKELAVDAEFYLGTVQVQTGKAVDAVATFKIVRDKYPGTPQAEQAHSQVGQLLSRIDPKAAIPELQSFLSKFPKSAEVPAVLMALGTSQAAAGQTDAALTTLKKLAAEFPKSDPAPFSYFERSKILAGQQKFDECLTVMKDFITQYPDSPSLYQAYDFTAQILTSQGKGPEAIAIYDDFVAKRPKDPSAAEALLKLSALWKGYAEAQGNYIVIEQAKRDEWKKGIEKSTVAAEKLLADFPESQQVAQALNNLLAVQQLSMIAKVKTGGDPEATRQEKLKAEAELEKYFQDLAQKFADKPGTQAKVLFTLAAYTYTKDKAKAVEQMTAAYKPNLKFAPEDLDLYGEALIENKKIDEAIKIYEKLNKDFPNPGGDPKAGSRDVQEAQAIILAGLGKALQEKGDPDSRAKGAKMFADLEANYPWSPKMLEVNYGTAVALHDQKKDDDAIKRIQEVIRAQKSSAELRAKSMLLLGKIHEANERFELAIDNYIKISVFYGGVPKVAAEGLWLGGQLLERQATGNIPMPTPTPKPSATPAAKKK
jgi:TolA-binding protein